MNRLDQPIQTGASFLGVICGSSFVSFLLPFAAIAQSITPPALAPPPVVAPQQSPDQPLTPPLPEQELPSTSVAPINGRITVRLVNRTGAAISYQVIGDTQERSLGGNASVTLQALRTPTNITFYRQDRGLLQVRPQASSGLLTATFTATTDLSVDKNILSIQQSGLVFLS